MIAIFIVDKQYEIINGDGKCCLRVTPLFLEGDPDSRFNIGVFGEAEFPHPPLPYPRYYTMITFMADKLYVIGGFNADDRTLDHIYGKFVDCLDLKEVKKLESYCRFRIEAIFQHCSVVCSDMYTTCKCLLVYIETL